jgi:hypothetical protein
MLGLIAAMIAHALAPVLKLKLPLLYAAGPGFQGSCVNRKTAMQPRAWASGLDLLTLAVKRTCQTEEAMDYRQR